VKPSTTKLVYHFSEGDKDQDLLGGKGANLAEMTRLGLPVPPGFTITTEACRYYLEQGREPDQLRVQVTMALRRLEDEVGRHLGDSGDPLLVSVRSGAKFSMPGMMETVLNVGLNDRSVLGLVKASGDERFAWDSYRRLIQMFGKTVLGVDGEAFGSALDAAKERKGVETDVELEAKDLQELVEEFKQIIVDHTGEEFPPEPRRQLDLATRSVFDSWNTKRAKLYRRRERIPHDLGTAVNVCTMVFGNLGSTRRSGVSTVGCGGPRHRRVPPRSPLTVVASKLPVVGDSPVGVLEEREPGRAGKPQVAVHDLSLVHASVMEGTVAVEEVSAVARCRGVVPVEHDPLLDSTARQLSTGILARVAEDGIPAVHQKEPAVQPFERLRAGRPHGRPGEVGRGLPFYAPGAHEEVETS
jgi:hypothetical protein